MNQWFRFPEISDSMQAFYSSEDIMFCFSTASFHSNLRLGDANIVMEIQFYRMLEAFLKWNS